MLIEDEMQCSKCAQAIDVGVTYFDLKPITGSNDIVCEDCMYSCERQLVE